MMDNLEFKIGARVKLTSNINTSDSLVNGVFGTVAGFESNCAGNIEYIVVTFDDPKCGQQQRLKYATISSRYHKENGTPIARHELEHIPRSMTGYSHAIKCKVIQFPLKLSWASTAHSMQGVTVKSGSKLIVHWHKKMKAGMVYVMLGRCERLNDIYINRKDFDIGKIKAKEEALEESESLLANYQVRMDAKNRLQNCLQICYLNVRSLWAHLEDIKRSSVIMSSTIIGLGETWMDQGTTIDLQGLHGIFENVGRGKGLAAYHKQDLQHCKTSSDSFSAIKVFHTTFDVIFLYLSHDLNWPSLQRLLEKWLIPDRPTVIMGDMNWHWSEDCNHPMKDYLERKGLQQLVRGATHDQGHCLDQIHVNKDLMNLKPLVETQSAYYSDHDIICICFPDLKSH